MIRRLTEADRDTVLAYLAGQASYNVFTIGDIENFGMKTEFQDVWADMDGTRYRAVVLRYYTHYIVYSADGVFDNAAVTGALPQGDGARAGPDPQRPGRGARAGPVLPE